jgi:hypothetical protein
MSGRQTGVARVALWGDWCLHYGQLAVFFWTRPDSRPLILGPVLTF